MYNSKDWYKSKTLWGILLSILIVVAQMFGVVPEVIPDRVEQLLQIALGLWTWYGRVTAKTTIK
jgi:hypothetical protein